MNCIIGNIYFVFELRVRFVQSTQLGQLFAVILLYFIYFCFGSRGLMTPSLTTKITVMLDYQTNITSNVNDFNQKLLKYIQWRFSRYAEVISLEIEFE